jgi:circadian clock protein KaiA
LPSSLSICIFCDANQFEQLLSPHLGELPSELATHTYTQFDSLEKLLDYIQHVAHVDCLVLQASAKLQPFLDQLQQQAMFFPAVIVELQPQTEPQQDSALAAFSYHPALMKLAAPQLNQLGLAIDQAISKFIQLQPEAESVLPVPASEPLTQQLTAQQLRLAEKLKARLGYLGVYYKRNPQNFLRHMTPPQKDEVLRQLRQDYRKIILSYFQDQPHLNSMIDSFVNVAFFADVPISQIVEMHMDLMDEFSKQLKLEGRSDEILLDYRLTLIDTLAHLCEMYRRSIPRES